MFENIIVKPVINDITRQIAEVGTDHAEWKTTKSDQECKNDE
jgi:hypothetical protein